ncbi:hypothetical protein EK904_002503 [Melospiza melodia maxima]|nr:hypothetical protein EK904_002503 [Melospiza melodia maxima]
MLSCAGFIPEWPRQSCQEAPGGNDSDSVCVTCRAGDADKHDSSNCSFQTKKLHPAVCGIVCAEAHMTESPKQYEAVTAVYTSGYEHFWQLPMTVLWERRVYHLLIIFFLFCGEKSPVGYLSPRLFFKKENRLAAAASALTGCQVTTAALSCWEGSSAGFIILPEFDSGFSSCFVTDFKAASKLQHVNSWNVLCRAAGLAGRQAGEAVHSVVGMAPQHVQWCACDIGDPCQNSSPCSPPVLQCLWEQLPMVLFSRGLRITLNLASGYPSPVQTLYQSQKGNFRPRGLARPLLSPEQPWSLMKRIHVPSAKGAIFQSPQGWALGWAWQKGRCVRVYIENIAASNPHPDSTRKAIAVLCQHTWLSVMSWGSGQQAELSYNAPRLAGAQATPTPSQPTQWDVTLGEYGWSLLPGPLCPSETGSDSRSFSSGLAKAANC